MEFERYRNRITRSFQKLTLSRLEFLLAGTVMMTYSSVPE